MKKTLYYLTFCFISKIILLTPLFSQITFNNAISTPSIDINKDVIQTSDGGYMFVGGIYTMASGGDVQVIKTDANGAIQWQKTYGTPNPISDEGRAITQTADGGYIIGGDAISLTTPTTEYAIFLKINSTGTLVWSKKFGTGGSNNSSHVVSIQATSDGGAVFTGDYGNGGASGQSDVCLTKLDASGNITWHKALKTATYNESGNWVEITSDGGYIIACTGGSFSNQDPLLIKTNSLGAVLWSKSYGGTGGLLDEALMVKQTSDGGYIFTGETYSYGFSGDTYIVKTDASGNVIWSEVLRPSSGNGGASSIAQTNDGGYILNSGGLTKINSTGDILWQKNYSGDPVRFRLTSDGGIVLAGITTIMNPFNYDDTYMFKTDGNGTNCASNVINTQTKISVTTTPISVTLTSSSPIAFSTNTLTTATTAYSLISKCNCPVDAGIDKSFICSCCVGGCVGVTIGTASTGYTYSWTPTTGLSCTTCATPTAIPTATSTNYTLTVSGGSCISQSDVVNVFKTSSTSCCGPKSMMTPTIKENISINIFPNPNNGNFELHVESQEIIVGDVEIVDALGRIVRSLEQTELNNLKLFLGNEPEGIYNIIITYNNISSNKKVVISN